VKRNDKNLNLMIRVRKKQGSHTDLFYQEVKRIKFNFVSTLGAVLDVLDYLEVGMNTGKWKLMENRQVEADIVKFRMDEKTKKLSHVEVEQKLKSCRFLEFRAECERPYRLSPMIALLVTESEVLILASREAPLQFADDFTKAVQDIFIPIVFRVD